MLIWFDYSHNLEPFGQQYDAAVSADKLKDGIDEMAFIFEEDYGTEKVVTQEAPELSTFEPSRRGLPIGFIDDFDSESEMEDHNDCVNQGYDFSKEEPFEYKQCNALVSLVSKLMACQLNNFGNEIENTQAINAIIKSSERLSCSCPSSNCKGCGAAISICKMHDHATICSGRQLHCPLCNKAMAASILVDHLQHECKRYFVNCWRCSVPCTRSELEEHREIWHNARPRTAINCPIRNASCETVSKLACPLVASGCTFYANPGNPGAIDNHCRSCPMWRIVCLQCGTTINRNRVEEHRSNCILSTDAKRCRSILTTILRSDRAKMILSNKRKQILEVGSSVNEPSEYARPSRSTHSNEFRHNGYVPWATLRHEMHAPSLDELVDPMQDACLGLSRKNETLHKLKSSTSNANLDELNFTSEQESLDSD